MAWRALLAEGAGDDLAGAAAASRRVHAKLRTHLVPILGAAGVDALLARSAQLSARDLPFLEGALGGDVHQLIDRLQEQSPENAAAAAVALFGTFLGLLTTFIGERLTTQALLTAWPALAEPIH